MLVRLSSQLPELAVEVLGQGRSRHHIARLQLVQRPLQPHAGLRVESEDKLAHGRRAVVLHVIFNRPCGPGHYASMAYLQKPVNGGVYGSARNGASELEKGTAAGRKGPPLGR